MEKQAHTFLNERLCYVALKTWARQLEVKLIVR